MATELKITHQTYTAHTNGKILKTISFGSVELLPSPEELPHLIRVVGSIAAVGFNPYTVKVKAESQSVVFSATEQQVETALNIRHSNVHATGVSHGSTNRLLIIQSATKEVNTSTREAVIFERWRGVLARLAQ